MTQTYSHQHNNIDIDFEYDFDPGEPETLYYQDGSGHPGSAPSVTILKAYLALKDANDKSVAVDILPIINELHDIDIDNIHDLILEWYAEN
tara:strand:- start:4040 stop:4312 length:273 start_codon:yes stop_codon:yes gene_type:complete